MNSNHTRRQLKKVNETKHKLLIHAKIFSPEVYSQLISENSHNFNEKLFCMFRCIDCWIGLEARKPNFNTIFLNSGIICVDELSINYTLNIVITEYSAISSALAKFQTPRWYFIHKIIKLNEIIFLNHLIYANFYWNTFLR